MIKQTDSFLSKESYNPNLKVIFRFGFEVCLIFAFLLPKINLSGSLKIDDIFFGTVFLVSLSLVRRITRYVLVLILLFALLLLIYVVSLILNYDSSSLFFIARYFMYFTAILAGVFFSQVKHFNTREKSWFVILLSFIAVLFAGAQKMGFIGGSIDGVWLSNVTDRVPGATSHPTEYALLLLVLLLLNARVHLLQGASIRYILVAVLGLTSILLTGSRTSLLVALIYVFATFLKSLRYKWLRATYFAIVLGSLPFLLWTLTYGTRLGTSLNKATLLGVVDVFRHPEAYSYHSFADLPTGMDASIYIRVSKWASVIQSAEHHIFGLGAGSFGTAVDGLYLRLLGETGVPGLIILVSIWLYLIRVFRKDYIMKLFVFIIAINSITIDTIYFSRFGYIFWLLIGYEMHRNSAAIQAKRSLAREREGMSKETHD